MKTLLALIILCFAMIPVEAFFALTISPWYWLGVPWFLFLGLWNVGIYRKMRNLDRQRDQRLHRIGGRHDHPTTP